MTVCPRSLSPTRRCSRSHLPQLSFSRWPSLGTIAISLAIAFGVLAFAHFALNLWLLPQQWGLHRLSSLFTAEGFQASVEQIGLWGPLLYVLLLVVSVVVSQLPGAGLAIAAGAIWGPFTAGLYTVIGGFFGALIAYGLGQAIGPAMLKALTGKTITFSKDRGELYLGGLIFLMRLIPVFSFDLISYGAGITRLSLPIYASATLLGMVPSTFLLTYLGGSFHWGTSAMVGIIVLFVAGMLILPWGVRRHNWFALQGIVQID